ncbi:MAG: YggU family protein [Gammaproteobacteria bacterium RIFCSPHIGHO2_12_FULL_38_14]|nr:MAG: YggU family protein [Gammaproteobacteria bacterium RIFCSPHIGHO2_12_FULL_38_14]
MNVIAMAKNEIILNIYLQPGAKKSELSGMHNGYVKIKVNSPPVDGKANAALILFLSKFLKIPKSSIKIISGEKSKIKKLSISGLVDEYAIKNKLLILPE